MKFDAITIGAGQANKPLSYALADLGWKVAFIERAQLGEWAGFLLRKG